MVISAYDKNISGTYKWIRFDVPIDKVSSKLRETQNKRQKRILITIEYEKSASKLSPYFVSSLKNPTNVTYKKELGLFKTYLEYPGAGEIYYLSKIDPRHIDFDNTPNWRIAKCFVIVPNTGSCEISTSTGKFDISTTIKTQSMIYWRDIIGGLKNSVSTFKCEHDS
jgi:hypothetical protein